MGSRSGRDSKQKSAKKKEKLAGRWEEKITLDECQLNEQTAKNKHKQTSALAMVDTQPHSHPHAHTLTPECIYIYINM